MAKSYPMNKIVCNIYLLDEVPDMTTILEHKHWVLRNGDVVKISDLRKTHIQNILEMMNINIGWRAEFKPLLEAELVDRLHLKIANSSRAGRILYGKNKVS